MILRPNKKTLHDYQSANVDKLLSIRESAMVESPTGSGKTTIAATYVAISIDAAIDSHAIIVAPQKHIEGGFTECNGMEVRFPRGKHFRRKMVIPLDMIRSPIGGKRSICHQVIEYLKDPRPGYALAISHATATTLLRLHGAETLPNNLSGKSLIVDEAHHAGADGLGGFVDAWEERGGRLLYFSATPYRGDGRKVARKGMIPLKRTLAEHMASGLAPGNLASELVPFGSKGDKVTGAEFSGEAMSGDVKQQRQLTQAMITKWEGDGRPKTIVRVPVLTGGSGPVVKALVKKFTKAGARVYDATGPGKQRQAAFQDMLERERGADFASSAYDVVIGIQRVVEGTDWVHCSDVYCVGVPSTMNAVVQLVGRATRKKGVDHPRADTAKITFFVPSAGGDVLNQLSLEHSRHTLMTCVFMADHECGEEWIVTREVKEGLGGQPVVPTPGEPDADDREIDPSTYAQIKLAMAAAIEGRDSATVGELVEAARIAVPGASEADLAYVAVRLIAAEGGATGVRGRGSIRKRIAEKAKLPPVIRRALEEAFAEIVGEFREERLSEVKSLRGLGEQMHRVSGETLHAVAIRFREANQSTERYDGPFTEEIVLNWAFNYKRSHGKLPIQQSGIVEEEPALRWSTVDARLRATGSSLATLLDYHYPDRVRRKVGDTEMNHMIHDYYALHQKWPTTTSGVIPGYSPLTWMTIEGRLKRNGSSLAKFIDENFINLKNQIIDDKTIIKLIQTFRETEKKWPNTRSGAISGFPRTTWKALNHFLERKGTSLSNFIGDNFPHAKRIPLSNEKIICLVTSYFAKYGKRPTCHTGEILGLKGYKWLHVEIRLRRQGSSLSRFIDAHFPESKRRTPLQEEDIKNLIKLFYDIEGRFPTTQSSIVHGNSKYTWPWIDSQLRRDGSSFAKFKAEHFPDSRKPGATRKSPVPPAKQSKPRDDTPHPGTAP